MQRARLQMLTGLAVGAMLGYLAATGNLNPFQRASAAQKPAAASVGGDRAACCADDLTKGQLLARAEPRELAAAAQASGRSRISWSSSATTSASPISAPTRWAWWATARRTSIG